MEVKCPQCGKPSLYEASNKYRPFCSERCAMLDLGAWADEKYKVPAVEHDVEQDAETEQESESVNKKSESESALFVDLPPKHHLN